MTNILDDMESNEEQSKSGQVERLYSQFPGLLLQVVIVLYKFDTKPLLPLLQSINPLVGWVTPHIHQPPTGCYHIFTSFEYSGAGTAKAATGVSNPTISRVTEYFQNMVILKKG